MVGYRYIKLCLFIALFSLSTSAQNVNKVVERTVVNPSFKARTGSINTITKVEMTDADTKLFVHVVFRPHWWVCLDSTIYLEDVSTGLRYQTTGIEGMKFGERFFMPDSGETDVVLTFPPLPESVKMVNWIRPDSSEDNTYGIDLTKDGEGLGVSEKRERWLAQNPQTGTSVGRKEGFTHFFHSDTTYVTGVLDHYDPILGFDTGIIYVQDMLEDKDRPVVIKIHPDGKLEGKVFLEHPSRCLMVIGENNSLHRNIYLEPGKTLSLYIDFEDMLARSRARDWNYPLSNLMYGDELGEINRQLAEAPEFTLGYLEMKEMESKLAPKQVREKWDEAVSLWHDKLSQYMDKQQVCLKVRQLLPLDEKISGAYWLLDYAMDYTYGLANDTTGKAPLPMEFFSFLRDMPLNDEKILAVNKASIFINRFAFMDWLQKQAYEKLKACYGMVIPSDMTPLQTAERMFYPYKIQTEILMEYLNMTEIPFLWQLVLCNKICTVLEAEANKKVTQQDLKTTQTMSCLKDSFCAMITYPVLTQAIESSHREYLKKQPYQLPPCEGTDIFRKITESYKGKILLVDFWSTGCGPCRFAIERSADLRAKWRGHKDVQFIFITSEGESPEKPYKEYVEKNLKGEAVYRIPSSDYQRLRELFSFNGIPRYILVGRDGKIISNDYQHIYLSEALEKDLKALGVNLDEEKEK